eukprot:2206922-Pyramimonas_sp.AAC.1
MIGAAGGGASCAAVSRAVGGRCQLEAMVGTECVLRLWAEANPDCGGAVDGRLVAALLGEQFYR